MISWTQENGDSCGDMRPWVPPVCIGVLLDDRHTKEDPLIHLIGNVDNLMLYCSDFFFSSQGSQTAPLKKNKKRESKVRGVSDVLA